MHKTNFLVMPVMCIAVGLLFSAVSAPALADLATAQRLYQQGLSDQALNEVESLLIDNPADAELRFLKGIILAEQGRNDEAIEIFAGLTTDYPELPEPYNNLAVLFADKGDFEKSREALLAAIQTHPSYSTAHENLGDLYAKMASLAYNRALQEDRANESARIKLQKVDGLFSVPVPLGTVASTSQPAQAPAAAAPEPVSQTTPAVAAAIPEPEPITPVTPDPEPVVPAPTPVPTPVTSTANPQAVVDAIQSWRGAWSAQDVSGYINAYTSGYSTRGLSRSGWEAQRAQRLSAPSFISVDVDDISVSFTDASTARATFVQEYRSDNYRDRVRKTLVLNNVNGGWRIARESSEPL